ncbi:YfcE family phosphodiesterase [Stutzerimonas nosocomialis]|uniref:metallophosphoesterase family protein n=1 Tax=Stutzerimonas nosocomialis TaxID=1056496 RepID=UPI0011098E7A|nr:metallophosphoesterase family protein [Stutzerimonas nosocomialis]TLX59804.1 YfcE family phosphodiesterase [Stutzerimonas nosocomialis]
MDLPTHRALRIGLIADTHGLLRPEALERLSGCDHIVHAGDIGKPEILQALERLAPLSVVRGNNDQQDWAQAIPERLVIHFGRVSLYLLHDLKELDIDPAAEGIRVVISGHSHKPAVEERDGVIYLNPGSAGPRRFKLPISLALLHIQGRDVKPELLTLG